MVFQFIVNLPIYIKSKHYIYRYNKKVIFIKFRINLNNISLFIFYIDIKLI